MFSIFHYSASDSASAVDPDMPNPMQPMLWQCTDKAAIKNISKNRSCLAYDNTNGYTFFDGECIPSDYNGCIDTYNKFRDLNTCTEGMIFFISYSKNEGKLLIRIV